MRNLSREQQNLSFFAVPPHPAGGYFLKNPVVVESVSLACNVLWCARHNAHAKTGEKRMEMTTDTFFVDKTICFGLKKVLV